MRGLLHAATALAAAFLLVIPVVHARGTLAARPCLHAVGGWAMGTTWSLRAWGPASLDESALRADVERELAELDRQLSGWRDDSALAALNRAPVGQWQALPPHLGAVLRFGKQLHDESGGAFDLTVLPLVHLWGFGRAAPRATLPSAEEIAAARARLCSDCLEISPDGTQVRRTADVVVDDDAIAPGYVADVLSGWLAQRGLPDHLVEVDGDVRVSGSRPDGQGWRIGIDRPTLAHGEPAAVLTLRAGAVATSGDYRDYVEIAGDHYSHIIDPVRGKPVEHALSSVTVVASTAMAADGYATTLMVLGPERGAAWADMHRLPVYRVERTANGALRGRYNEAFAPYPAPP